MLILCNGIPSIQAYLTLKARVGCLYVAASKHRHQRLQLLWKLVGWRMHWAKALLLLMWYFN